MEFLTWRQNDMAVFVTQGSIVVVHDNSVQGLVEYVCGSKTWYSNNTFCSFYSLCHCVLFGSCATKQPWAYSRNGNSIFTETESSVSASVPPENTVPFLFLFPHKNTISTSILQISVSVFIFPLCFHFSSGKTENFHSIFIPTMFIYSIK